MAAPEGSCWVLIPLNASHHQRPQQLTNGNVVVEIGRSRACLLCFETDPGVSKVHCSVRPYTDGCALELVNSSKNDIRVNKTILKRGESCRITNGDVVELTRYPGPDGRKVAGSAFRVERSSASDIVLTEERVAPSFHALDDALRNEKPSHEVNAWQARQHDQRAAKCLRTGAMERRPVASPARAYSSSIATDVAAESRSLRCPLPLQVDGLSSGTEMGATSAVVTNCSSSNHFSVSVAAEAQPPDTSQFPDDHDLRSQVRSALRQGLSGESESHAEPFFSRVDGVAELIEKLMFWKHEGTTTKYRQHARMLKANLTAARNHDLCARLLSGDLSVETLLQMDSSEMAPKELQLQREEAFRKSLREVVVPEDLSTSLRPLPPREILVSPSRVAGIFPSLRSSP